MKRFLLAVFTALMMQRTAMASGDLDQPISLNVGPGTINGSLMLPAVSGKTPVVLIISGSGPTDRDGNSNLITGKNDSLKMLALALAGAGFASVRYDKRGIGASATAAPREEDLRFETYVQDAATWIDRLAGDDRFSRVAVAGHSEGALIGMVAAIGKPVTAYVSLAGVASRASTILRQQLHGKLPADLAARNETILSSLEKGQVMDDIPAPLASLYRRSVQPYLASWFRYVPAQEFKKLRMPCLILQGDTDIQVPVAEARALKDAKPDAELQIVQGMNHLLKMVPADPTQQIASYGDPTLPLAPELSIGVSRFLAAAVRDQPGGEKK